MIYFNLFLMFARIGLFGFGGGYAMLPLIFQSVQTFGLMSGAEFADLVALSQITPGPIAVNAATYVGFKSAGFLGAAIATLGVALPSFVLILLVVKFLQKFKESSIIEGVFFGIRPATVGLIGAAAIFLGEAALLAPSVMGSKLLSAKTLSLLVSSPGEVFQPVPCLIFLAALALIGKWEISPIKITLAAGVVGALLGGIMQ